MAPAPVCFGSHLQRSMTTSSSEMVFSSGQPFGCTPKGLAAKSQRRFFFAFKGQLAEVVPVFVNNLKDTDRVLVTKIDCGSLRKQCARRMCKNCRKTYWWIIGDEMSGGVVGEVNLHPAAFSGGTILKEASGCMSYSAESLVHAPPPRGGHSHFVSVSSCLIYPG